MKLTLKLTLSRDEVIGMTDFDLCNHLWWLVNEEYFKEEREQEREREAVLCDYPESLFAVQLPEHWWTAYGIHAFESDVLAGGILQFLDNHNGLTNEQTAAAFRNVGHPDLADAFLIVGNAYLAFRRERCPDYSELSDSEYDAVIRDLNELILESGKKGFEQIHDGLNLRTSLAKYIRENYNLYAQ